MRAVPKRTGARDGVLRVEVHVEEVRKDVPGEALHTLRNGFGAYVLRVDSGARYVGSSNTTRSRVQAHRVANDPSVTEPIRSACCYVTRGHMDARILENWLIREIGPELNLSCPSGVAECGARCAHACEAIAPPGRPITISVGVRGRSEGIRPDALDRVPTGAGVYVLRTESGKRYVGVSGALRGRVRAHRDHPAHPNLDGPLRLIDVVETATEADARILEYALIRDLAPELNRENQPDASEWKVGSREALVALATQDLAALQQALARRIVGEVGGKEIVRKSWVTYQLSPLKNFCAVKLLADALQVDLKLPARVVDPEGLSEAIRPTQAWTFNRRLRIRSEAELDGALRLIARALRHVASME